MQSYSWEGEDILVRKIMHDVLHVKAGFYVDIGAHHPSHLSNTALLYSEGWRGINIDATPGSMEPFRKLRPDDTNLELAIGPETGKRLFWCFTNPALNGLHSERQVKLHASRGNPPVRSVEIDCRTINDVFETYVGDRHVDLLNLDVEGLDFSVLQSLDLGRWRPTLILAEILGAITMVDVIKSDICQLLDENRYSLFSRLHFSAIFIDHDRLVSR